MKDIVKALFLGTPYIVCLSFFFFTMYWCIARESLAKWRIRKVIEKEVIEGNKIAIEMKKHSYRYRCDWEDEVLINEALNGNESAIEALGIDLKGEK